MVDIVRGRRTKRTVNLTPLIDVVFLLIVFFMLSTSFVMSESLELTLPGDGKAKAVTSDVMRLYVLPDGAAQVEAARYDMDALDSMLTKRLAANPDQKILILSSKGVDVQQLVTVMDLVYLNGGRNVQMDRVR